MLFVLENLELFILQSEDLINSLTQCLKLDVKFDHSLLELTLLSLKVFLLDPGHVFNLTFHRTDRLHDRITFKFGTECWLYDQNFERSVILPEFFGQQLFFELADRVDFHLVIVNLRAVVDTIECFHHDCDENVQHSDCLKESSHQKDHVDHPNPLTIRALAPIVEREFTERD